MKSMGANRGDMVAVRSPQGDLFCEGCAPVDLKVCLSCGEPATEPGCEVFEHPGCGVGHPETAVAMEDEIAGVQPLWQGDKRLLPGASCKKCEKVFVSKSSEYIYSSKSGRTAGPCGDCGTLMVFQDEQTIVCLNCEANGRPALAVAADEATVEALAAQGKKGRGSA